MGGKNHFYKLLITKQISLQDPLHPPDAQVALSDRFQYVTDEAKKHAGLSRPEFLADMEKAHKSAGRPKLRAVSSLPTKQTLSNTPHFRMKPGSGRLFGGREEE